MTTASIDVRATSKRDLWTTQDNAVCVRPGMRQLYTPPSGTKIVRAFTVRNDFAEEVLHYVVVYDSTNRLVRVLVLDENFDTFSDFRVGTDAAPRAVSHVVVEGQILICSPDFPTIWGQVGSGMRVAEPVASINKTTTAIDVPRGIACRFSNRAAVAFGRVLYFSDPVAPTGGDLRTFVVENVNGLDGVIYGIHEGAGGAVVCVTSQGTWALSTDAAAVQVVGSNGTAWQQLSHHSAYAYRSSCAHRGRIWATSQRGIIMCDDDGEDDVPLSDAVGPRLYGPRAHLSDYRRGTLEATDAGPALRSRDLGLVARYDVSRKFVSWWTTPDEDNSSVPGDFVGTLHDVDGREMLAMTNGVYSVEGDYDGQAALNSPFAAVSGSLFFRVESPPSVRALVRSVDFAAQCDGANRIDVALRAQSEGGIPVADTLGLVVGTSSWGDSKIWQPTPIAGMRGRFGEGDQQAVRDATVECRAQGCGARLAATVDVDTADDAQARPQNSGARP